MPLTLISHLWNEAFLLPYWLRHHHPLFDHGVLLDARHPHVARQNPGDYITGLRASVTGALADAQREPGFSRERVIGIGADTTGSTPLPVDAQARPLAADPLWAGNLAAHAWLWKDHSAAEEAAAIAATHAPQYLAPIGGTYSSEWWWSKIWRCLKVAPDVFDAAASWVELADFVPAVLSGVDDSRKIVRCVCAAGHKAMYSDAWGGLPSKAFLSRLDPKLAALRDRLYDQAHAPGRPAGQLSPEWAGTLGLTPGIAIAMGGFDAHYGAVGSGIRPGTLVKIIGTSTCDCAIAPVGDQLADIPGICGIVNGSIMPGYYGIIPWTEGQLIGSPDTIARRVQQFVDAGFNHIIPQTVTPGTPREVQQRWAERFAREVAPRFSSAFSIA